MSNVCPNPPPTRDRTRKDIICFRCGKPSHIQANCQEVIARRSDSNAVPTPPAQTNATPQPKPANPTIAPTSRPFDPKRLAAFLASEYNEALGIVDVGTCSVGIGTDSSFTGLLMEEPPLISVPDALPHTSDDFLAVHADCS